jgi:hypothetical protein
LQRKSATLDERCEMLMHIKPMDTPDKGDNGSQESCIFG